MGKRKYETESADSVKKKRAVNGDSGEQVEANVSDADQPQNVERNVIKNASFDVKHFRKELAEKQGQTMVLTQFLQVCLNPDSEEDYMLKYLKMGGNSHEILRQITQENKKNLTLATPAFHLFHLIIVKVQSSLPHLISITEEACRYFLNTFIPTVEIMISENSGPRHRKIILNLLTSMVTLNSDLGVEVLNQVPLTPKHLQYIVEKPNYKEKDNVRTAFVHFMTSFLVDGHLPLIKALLEKQGLLPLVVPGLVHDDPEAVLMFLNILKKNIIENPLISKTLKLKMFSHQVLQNMFRVFMWKGPPEMSQELKNDARPEIIDLLSNIMLTLFTSHRLGLYFVDKTLGTSDVNKNQNLYKALLSLKRPWENEKQCEVILEIIAKCPDLHRAIINIVEQSFQPLHSPIWEKTTEFVVKLLNKLRPEDMTAKFSNLNPAQVTNFVRFITLPVPLLKHIQANMGKELTISLYCIKVLVKMLQTLKRYIQILGTEDTNENINELKTKLDSFLPKHLPAPKLIVGLVQDVIAGVDDPDKSQDYKLPKVNATHSLLSLVDLLLLYNYIYPAYFESLEGNMDMKKILDFSMTLTDGQISQLKFKVVSLWLTLDNTIISLKNTMFKDLFQILLEVYTSDTDDTWFEAKDTLVVFFKSTGIFEADEDEIHLMLYTLRNAKVDPISLVADTVEYALANSRDLAEYVKTQMVHFEVSDESSGANLDKLFHNLMSNSSTADSVFLESKIPSAFIVGCMQFILHDKEKKKHLKHFLSLYIVNLLHYNYSPELTEVLIGDSKIDARNYVVEWTSQPSVVPETFVKDVVLNNISKSLLSDEIELLEGVFPFLEMATSEDYDVVITDVYYKIKETEMFDSAELFVWAKYLMFCIVRLTNMNQLTEFQLQKATIYFECIIAVGRKYHMLETCRRIILNVLKDSHFLKIYAPLDTNKNSMHILATKFILNVIKQHRDIINYLNQRHFVMRCYQQKNFSEIIKAFVKINKRKNVNSDHTLDVLEVVGLSNEDDLLVLNEIFGTKIESCIKDDKEPSIVLELLRLLLQKYSITVSLDLPQDMLRKSMTLYTDLLTSKEVTPDLSNLENALIQYFQNKPHETVRISEDQFKKFFVANAIRKTTSQLASIFLHNNPKFCGIFVEEIDRQEILSQRELTLPLGVAAINHNSFIRERKDFLSVVFEEYKTNILKFLEKPHKAGQIYIFAWKFIRKLLIECMDVEDCKRIFTKVHKFEVAELTHVHLLQATFLKLCACGDLNVEYFLNYSMDLLQIMIIAVKDAKDDVIIDEIVINLSKVVKVFKSTDGFNTEKNIFNKITESSLWQNFCKNVLRDSLKVRTMEQPNAPGPKLLCILSTLVTLFYPEDHNDVVTLFDMVTSHSEFLNVMLSYHSPDVKSRLLEFLYALMSKNKSVMKPQQIPVYLSSYHATRSPSDRIIMKILHFYETNNLPVNEYKPYVWGDSAANYYSVRKNRTSSLWGHPTPNQVLNLFDRDVIEKTVRYFPVNQKLDYNYELSSNLQFTSQEELVKQILDRIQDNNKLNPLTDVEETIKDLENKSRNNKLIGQLKDVDLLGVSHLDTDEGIYDPLFMFPLLSHLLAPGSVASCFKMMRTGLLSVAVMALSSQCPNMRSAAYHVLHRFCLLLETETRHKNDKLLLTDFITTLRQSLSTATEVSNGEGPKNPRLPAVGALYLAKALMVSTASSDPLYKPVNNFLIAKQFVDLTVVPDFLSLFHDSDVEYADRRLWILDIIRHGTKTMTDVNVIFKTMCLKMIMDYYSTVLSDRRTREKIISVLNSIITIPRAFEILVDGYGLIAWVHSVVRQLGAEDEYVVKEIFVLIRSMIISLDLNVFGKHYSKYNVNNGKTVDMFAEVRVKSDVEYEILSVTYNLLPHVQQFEMEEVLTYVGIYRLISKRTVKYLTKKQMLNIIKKCTVKLKECESVKILTQSVVFNNAVMLKSKNVVNDSAADGVLIRELNKLVQTYII